MKKTKINETYIIPDNMIWYHATAEKGLTKLNKPSIDKIFFVSNNIMYSANYIFKKHQDKTLGDYTQSKIFYLTLNNAKLNICNLNDEKDISKFGWPKIFTDLLIDQQKTKVLGMNLFRTISRFICTVNGYKCTPLIDVIENGLDSIQLRRAIKSKQLFSKDQIYDRNDSFQTCIALLSFLKNVVPQQFTLSDVEELISQFNQHKNIVLKMLKVKFIDGKVFAGQTFLDANPTFRADIYAFMKELLLDIQSAGYNAFKERGDNKTECIGIFNCDAINKISIHAYNYKDLQKKIPNLKDIADKHEYFTKNT